MALERKYDTPSIVWRWFNNSKDFWTKMRMLKLFIDHLPQWTYPSGIDEYYRVAQSEGRENVLARHNLWRQVWHCIAGIVLGLFCALFTPHTLIALIVFGVALAKEVWDATQSPRGWILKSTVDVFAWTFGGLIVSIIIGVWT